MSEIGSINSADGGTRRAKTISVDCSGDGTVRIRPGAAGAYPEFVQAEKTPPPEPEAGADVEDATSLGRSDTGLHAPDVDEADAGEVGAADSIIQSKEADLAIVADAPIISPRTPLLVAPDGRGSAMKAVAALASPERAAARSSFWRARHCCPPAKCAALNWDAQDRRVEAEIFAEVDPSNLSPVQKAWRSEKATVLLYGYLNTAERDTLRKEGSNPQRSSSQQQHEWSADDMLMSESFENPANAKSDDPLEQFLACEDSVEVGRFRAERWVDKVWFFKSVDIFRRALQEHFARKTLRDVLTPMVLFRVTKWRQQAAREMLRTSRERDAVALGIRKPTWQFLKMHSKYFLDWPQICLERLVDSLVLEHYPANTAIYFSGEIGSRDMYFVGKGNCEAVYYTPGKDSSRPKSRRKANGAVVEVYNTGDFFGHGVHLTDEPRTTSVFCTVDTDVYRLPHRGFVDAAAGVAEITYELMQRYACAERHEHLLRVHPICVEEVCMRNDVMQDWPLHVARLLLNTKLRMTLRKQGEVLIRQGDRPNGMAFLVVTGLVRLDPPVDGKAIVTANEFVGLQELVVPDEYCRFTATVVCSSDIAVLDRETGFVPVLRDNAECGVGSRARAASCLAARLDAHPPMPRAVLCDVALNYVLTPELFGAMWSMVQPFVALQGDELFFDFTPASLIYVITSGALYERHSSNGGQSAGLPDPSVMMQRQVVVGTNLSTASPQPKTSFGSDLSEFGGYLSLTDAYYHANKLATAAALTAEGNQQSFIDALVLGSVEMAMQRPTYVSSVRCLSICSGYVVSRRELELYLKEHEPLVYSALTHETSIGCVRKNFSAKQLPDILKEPAPRSAAIRR